MLTKREYVDGIARAFNLSDDEYRIYMLHKLILYVEDLEKLDAIFRVSPSWYNAGLKLYDLLETINYLTRETYTANQASISLKEFVVRLNKRKTRDQQVVVK